MRKGRSTLEDNRNRRSWYRKSEVLSGHVIHRVILSYDYRLVKHLVIKNALLKVRWIDEAIAKLYQPGADKVNGTRSKVKVILIK